MDVESMGEAGGVVGSALIDQRMRADRHKYNFETLKAQHMTLQETYQNTKLEYENISESYDRLYQRSQEIIQKLQSERNDKIIECEGLRKQVLTRSKLEQLRSQIIEEIESPLRKRVNAAEEQMEAITSEHNKLRYNYAFLKSEYDTIQASHQSVIQELLTKHEAEVSALLEERKSALSHQGRDVPTDLQRIRQLERDNSELHQKVKSLIAENEGIQAEKELAEEHNKQNHELVSRQVMELHARNKTLEVEISSSNSQTQSLQTELTKSYRDLNSLSEQVTQAQRELTNSTRKLEEIEHKHSMDMSELNMQHVERCRELEQEKERSALNHMTCQAQLEAISRTLQEQDTLLADKEQQVEQRVQCAREKEWERQVVLEREKVELEERITELQRLQESSVEGYKQQVDRAEVTIDTLQKEKSELESELERTKIKLQEKSHQLQALSNEVQQLSNISKKYQTVSAEHRSLQQSENLLRESERKLEDSVRQLEEELSSAEQNLHQMKENHKLELERERQLWSEEKDVLNERIEECQAYQHSANQKHINAKKEAKKLQKHYKKQAQELKQVVSMTTAKMEQLKSEKEAAVTSFNLENKKLKNQLSKIQRKRKEFLFFLQHDPHSVIPGRVSPDHSNEARKKHNFEEVCQRAEELEASQNLHLCREEAILSAMVNQHNPTALLSPSVSNLSVSEAA